MKVLAINNGNPILKEKFIEKWPKISEEDIQSVEELLKKGEISYYGREGKIKEFEEEMCKYHGVKYALAVNSGTSSLHSAFFGINIGPGDEILCPTYTFLATVTPIFQCYAKPVLCDCEEDTGNISPEDIKRKITDKTKAIVITHMWGHPCDMDKILEICKKHKLLLIEDCSHAHGATYKGKKVGTFGDVGCFSFQANKIVTGGCAGGRRGNARRVHTHRRVPQVAHARGGVQRARDRFPRPSLQAEEKPHHGQDRGGGRHNHVHDDGVHPRREPEHTRGCWHPEGRGVYGDGSCRRGGNASNGVPFKLPVCPRSWHGAQRVFRLWRRYRNGLQLAVCAVDGIR